MGILANLFADGARVAKAGESRWTLKNPPDGAFNFINQVYSGVTVTTDTALSFSAVFASIRVLSESVAMLPLILYRRLPSQGKDRAIDHPLYSLLRSNPNPENTAYEFLETMVAHVNAWGNAYANIQWSSAGYPRYLWLLRPDRIEVKRNRAGELVYIYDHWKGGSLIERRAIPKAEILHIRGLSTNGITGLSPIKVHKQGIGLALAAERFGAVFFENNARPGAVLEYPGVLEDKDIKRLRESFQEVYGGLDNAHRVAVLEDGVTLKEVGIPPEDAQYIATRKFQIEEVARIYRIPPHKLGSLDKATFSNIEHQGQEFLTDSLMPWLVRFAQGISRDLLLDSERGSLFPEFLTEAILRGDIQARYNAYATARQWGWLSANDIRERENLNPIPGGDTYLTPLNMIDSADSRGGLPAMLSGLGDPLPDIAPGSGAERIAEEYREYRDIASRRNKAALAIRPVFIDVIGRILRREKNDILGAAQKTLKNRTIGDLEEFIREFYETNNREFTFKQLDPVIRSYAQTIADLVAEESGADISPADRDSFIKNYLGALAARYNQKHMLGILQAIQRAIDSGQDIIDTLSGLFGEWEESRPPKVALDESTRAGNALAKSFYVLIGYLSLRWVSLGDSCPYCANLDGREIGVSEFYLAAGEEFAPGGAEPLKVTHNIGHPPAHSGCDCITIGGARI